MSVKSMLQGKSQDDKVFQGLIKQVLPNKNMFITLSGKAAFSSYGLLLPYCLKNSYEAGTVGTAFDYLARAMIAQVLNKDKEYAVLQLKALLGIEILKLKLDEKSLEHIQNEYITVLTDFVDYIYSNNALLPEDFFDKCSHQEEFNAWSAYVNKCIYSGFKPIDDIEQLIRGACFFAILENIYRSGGIFPENGIEDILSEPSAEIKQDLSNLCSLFKERFIKKGLVQPDSTVIFNPSFGIGSLACGGADADIYIDGNLFDFKTSKKTGYAWQDVAQVVTYYYLNKIANYADIASIPAQLKDYKIINIAFYRARYGEIEYCSTDILESGKSREYFEKISRYLLEKSNLQMLF